MPRARISKDGVAVAKQGFDVDTADFKDMILSPEHVAMRIVMTGYVTVAPFTGYLSGFMDRAIVTYPPTNGFNNPPVVFASGVIDEDNADQSQFYYTNDAFVGGPFEMIPRFYVESYTDRFELYVVKNLHAAWGLDITRTWKYFVFANTLDP